MLLTPDTSEFDCGLNLHENTKLVCPRNSTKASPVSALHKRNVLSSLAVAIYEPVGDHATSLIPRLWPNKLIFGSKRVVVVDVDEDGVPDDSTSAFLAVSVLCRYSLYFLNYPCKFASRKL